MLNPDVFVFSVVGTQAFMVLFFFKLFVVHSLVFIFAAPKIGRLTTCPHGVIQTKECRGGDKEQIAWDDEEHRAEESQGRERQNGTMSGGLGTSESPMAVPLMNRQD